MTTDYVLEAERAWDETVLDAWAALDGVREVWRDEDRIVDLDPDEYRSES